MMSRLKSENTTVGDTGEAYDKRAEKYDNGHGPYAVRLTGSRGFIARVVNARYGSLCAFSAYLGNPSRATFEMVEIATGAVVGTRDGYTAKSTGTLA